MGFPPGLKDVLSKFEELRGGFTAFVFTQSAQMVAPEFTKHQVHVRGAGGFFITGHFAKRTLCGYCDALCCAAPSPKNIPAIKPGRKIRK
jgi:hypothetical protein